MSDLTPDHPAVEAAMLEMTKAAGPLARTAFRSQALREAHAALTAAREHYTADDLRDTPAGRDLLAEGWNEAVYDTGAWKQLFEFPPNPYEETPNE